MKKRSTLITLVVITVVLAAGVALAQGGSYLSPKTTVATPIPQKTETASPATVKADEPAEEVPYPKAGTDEEHGADAAPPSKDSPAKDSPARDVPTEEVAPPPDTTAPELIITSPKNGEHFTNKALDFSGTTEPAARVFAGKYEADVNDDGAWHLVLILAPGENRVGFRAKDATGNVQEATVTVFLDAEEGEFTAHQKYGSCSEPVPYDIFYGTGTPGSWIEVVSEFGSGETRVGDKGNWDLEVEFGDAPYGKTFPVKVRDSLGHVQKLSFTSYSKHASSEFTIHQYLVTSGEGWEKFYGTAPPGTGIIAISDYGSADLRVGESGEYKLIIEFTEPPIDQPFRILVETTADYREEFTYTYHPKPIEFTIHQYLVTSGEGWEKFYGTAPPGTGIIAISDYGSADLRVGESGEYKLIIEFTEPPIDQPFRILVETTADYREEFTYTYHPAK